VALLVAVFASNFPEALAGAAKMREQGQSRRSVVGLWAGATVLLAAVVFAGRFAFSGAQPELLSLPLAFAAGAVLASVIDTLASEAVPRRRRDGGTAYGGTCRLPSVTETVRLVPSAPVRVILTGVPGG